MIDEDWQPDRTQLRALGHLLLAAQNHPLLPTVRESDLYRLVCEGEFGSADRPAWFDELIEFGLIKAVGDSMRVGDRIGDLTADVCLTVAGSFYVVSRADLFAENAKSLTDDFPQEIVDAPWAIQQYYASSEPRHLTTQDEIIEFRERDTERRAAISAIDAVIDALASDNSIGADEPLVRDEKLEELRAIKELLEQDRGWRSKIVLVAWGALGFLATQFAERPVSALAETAWHAIQNLVGFH
jgi:hypothetical protein